MRFARVERMNELSTLSIQLSSLSGMIIVERKNSWKKRREERMKSVYRMDCMLVSSCVTNVRGVSKHPIWDHLFIRVSILCALAVLRTVFDLWNSHWNCQVIEGITIDQRISRAESKQMKVPLNNSNLFALSENRTQTKVLFSKQKMWKGILWKVSSSLLSLLRSVKSSSFLSSTVQKERENHRFPFSSFVIHPVFLWLADHCFLSPGRKMEYFFLPFVPPIRKLFLAMNDCFLVSSIRLKKIDPIIYTNLTNFIYKIGDDVNVDTALETLCRVIIPTLNSWRIPGKALV